MFVLHLITAFFVVFTGFYVLYAGNWSKFKLKYAGVALSTTAGIWFMFFLAMEPHQFKCEFSSMTCLSYAIYGIARNIAFVLFHISVGRDAINFKHRDRRSSQKIGRESHGRDYSKVA